MNDCTRLFRHDWTSFSALLTFSHFALADSKSFLLIASLISARAAAPGAISMGWKDSGVVGGGEKEERH